MDKDASFWAGKAGSFSGVPIRTVQSWVEKGLLNPGVADTTGTGSKRLFSVLNCVEIGIIKSLTDSRVSITMIKEIMTYIREYTLEEIISPGISPLLIGIEGDKTKIFGYFKDAPNSTPRDPLGNLIEDLFTLYENHEKTLILNIKKIADKVIKAIG